VRGEQSTIHDFPCYKDATFPVIAEGKQEGINTHTNNFRIFKPRGGHMQHSGGYSRLPVAPHIKPELSVAMILYD
jgi:hypothetical protein